MHLDVNEYNGIIDKDEIQVDYSSGPVDKDHPDFGSLLGALKAFHEGQAGLDVLKAYHSELSKQLKKSRTSLKAMSVNREATDIHALSLGALTYVADTLDKLEEYIASPGPETLSLCVESLLNSRGIVTYVNRKLDENIMAGEVKPE